MIERAPDFEPSARRQNASLSEDELALHERLELLIGEHSCRDIALLTGHHPETVRRYRRGQRPSLRFIVDLCDALDASADWLLRGLDHSALASEPVSDHFGDLTLSEALRLIAAKIETTPALVALEPR